MVRSLLIQWGRDFHNWGSATKNSLSRITARCISVGGGTRSRPLAEDLNTWVLEKAIYAQFSGIPRGGQSTRFFKCLHACVKQPLHLIIRAISGYENKAEVSPSLCFHSHKWLWWWGREAALHRIQEPEKLSISPSQEQHCHTFLEFYGTFMTANHNSAIVKVQWDHNRCIAAILAGNGEGRASLRVWGGGNSMHQAFISISPAW